jgi:catechol 2,3-dioxygenase-like lactoylglutathione lyase family enzyme
MTMKAKLLAAFGYQGDALNLPVADADGSAAFYVGTMGFAEVERGGEPVKRVVVERDGVRMGLAENGGDPEQDGCAFHTDDVAAAREEFAAGGAGEVGEIKSETRPDGSKFDAFFVMAPDGLCFWFGQKK